MDDSKKINWVFGKTDGGEETGINDPLTSHFLGNIANKLVREALQNSIDAGISKPVIVDFDVTMSKASEIPGINRLKDIYKLCLAHWGERKNAKDVESMLQTLIGKSSPKFPITVLKISDYNTRGLTPEDYRSLFQVVGDSSKREGAGGSFGLGKGAYFNASQYRVVIVSSKYDEDKYFFAGKTRLVSFSENNYTMQGSGTYGYEKQQPVIAIEDIPKFFRRKEKGTDFYIYGYKNSKKGWIEEISEAVLTNFWFSILQGKLVVRIRNKILDKNSLIAEMKKYHSSLKNKSEIKNSPYYFLHACAFGADKSCSETALVEKDLPTLGIVKFYIYKKEDCPNRIVYIRNTGMTIETKTLNAPYSYAGVFVCDNDEGNEILRKMENPEHNKWDKEIAKESGKLDHKVADVAAKELKDFINEVLKSFQDIETGEELKIKDLDKYLWLPTNEDELALIGGSSDGDKKTSDHESASVSTEIRQEENKIISKKEKMNVNKKPITGIIGGDDQAITGERGNGGTKGATGTEDPEGDTIIIPSSEFKFRSYAVPDSSGEGYTHNLILKAPNKDKLAKIVVRVGTDNFFEDVSIISALEDGKESPCLVESNVIKDITLDKNGEKKLKIQFVESNKYSLKVVAYGYK